MKLEYIFGCIWYLIVCQRSVLCCNRRPQGASGDQSAVDGNFQITIEGNPSSYIPGQLYNVTLACATSFKFISFTLVAEAEPGSPLGYDMTGHFELIDPAETRFSSQCENMIESTNTNFKNRTDVSWVAPSNPNSTCVYLKAAVLQHRNVWFMDDGFLTKRICPEEIDDVNSQTPVVNPCCACDEAKYEIVLERRWTRNTHAKYFPEEDWRTRFSEVIGASHTYDYRFWAYGTPATLGLKELAEHGATKTLESEIKENGESGSIRTIIKAPGVPFRKNIMGTTLATVRVDPRHHMISFVTKIIPSPDWILGVAGLELCLANCTWIERKVLNLFPWDVGTDAGPSYMSPDQQQVPADVVRRISSTYPSDYRSPFYDENGAPMKPMATLYMTRKKLYERECETDDNLPFECATHPWVDWSECSTKCGAGTQYRVRGYKDPNLAARFNCEVVLRQTQRCVGTQCGLPDNESDSFGESNAACELTPWSPWGPCSRSCGRGFAKRTRDFKNPYTRPNCQSGISLELEQTKECLGNACGGTIAGGRGEDFGGFNQYENEPQLVNSNTFTNNISPTRRHWSRIGSSGVNERWLMPEDYSNREPSIGDTNRDGYSSNNRASEPLNPQRNNYNENYGNDRSNYNYPNSNDNQMIDYSDSTYDRNRQFNDNSRDTYNPRDSYNYRNNTRNSYDNIGSVYEGSDNARNFYNPRDKTQNPYEDNRGGDWNSYNSMDNTRNSYTSRDNLGNVFNPSDSSRNVYNSEDNTYDSRSNFNNQFNVATIEPSYNQVNQFHQNERIADRVQSPGFHLPGTTSTDINRGTELREVYDEFGRKTLVATGTSPNDYNVIQEYCFERPYVVEKSCPGKKVISNYWFYDAMDRECKLFTTDNCDENKNKFRSLESCEGTCLQPQINLEKQQYQQQQPQEQQQLQRGGLFDWPDQLGEPQSQTRIKPNVYDRRNQKQRGFRGYGRF